MPHPWEQGAALDLLFSRTGNLARPLGKDGRSSRAVTPTFPTQSYQHRATWVHCAVSTSEDKYAKQYIEKKGRHSLVESVALKAPAELLYDS